MPTATTTTTAFPVLSLKASPAASSSASAAATLRSLYPRAARAFLQRDVALTHSLLSSAFALIHSPTAIYASSDSLASHRRKWDILRLTFDTTLYASPPSTHTPSSLPSSLRANLMLSPEALVTTLHGRSLHLFTPTTDPPQKPTAAFLPGQILVTLVLASLKLDCPDVGRAMIEDWLAKHGQESDADDPKAYAKVLELYCLHVLPRLQDWEYADDFLAYERELPSDVRQQFITSLRQLHSEASSTSRIQASLSTSTSAQLSPSTAAQLSASRTPSPAPSDSSASSSSTHTATPHSPRPRPHTNGHSNGRIHSHGLAPLTPSQTPTPRPTPKPHEDPHSASSSSIASTATSRTITPQLASRARARSRTKTNGHAHPRSARSESQSRERSTTPLDPTLNGTGSSTPYPFLRRASSSSGTPVAAVRAPSTLALLRASLGGLMKSLGTSPARSLFYAVLFVVVPLVSFALRVRRRRVGSLTPGPAPANAGTVDVVRRRLRGVAEGQQGAVGRLWEEVVRAVLDTVRMAGRGLV